MTYIVWMHHGNEVIAVAHYSDRAMANAYSSYCNRENPCKWFEVRRHAV